MERLLLIDGNSILNRGFYGLPLLTNKDGVYTNALLGFFNIFTKTLDECNPDYVIVAFDMKAPTFRHKMFAEYKGTRKPMPEELKVQSPIIRELLRSMGICVVECEGYEADDILGTFAKRYEKEGLAVTLLSGDRDLLQIASDHITIAIPKTFGGKTETKFYNTKDVLSEYGVTPLEFIDVKALQGDSSDNIPGVSKAGPKTATELIQTYKSIENLYEHIDEISKAGLKANLTNDKENAFLSKVLATIDVNAPVKADIASCKCCDFINDASTGLLRKYELKGVEGRLSKYSDDTSFLDITSNESSFAFHDTQDFDEIETIIQRMEKTKEFGFYALENVGFAVSFSKDETIFVRAGGMCSYDYLNSRISNAIHTSKRLATIDIKTQYSFLGEYIPAFYDISILAYLIDPLGGDYSAIKIGNRYLNFYNQTISSTDDEAMKASFYAFVSFSCVDVLIKEVSKLGMLSLYLDMEMPLSYVLYSMEQEGVLTDKKALKDFSEKLDVRIRELEQIIYDKAGMVFNINSPKQLGEVLFEHLEIKGGKKTKTGYSTAADVLEKLAGEYPIVSDILEFRGLSKLKSTYADGLREFIGEDLKIHAKFNQLVTATGRISSSEPNLQNIPVRTELGRELRKVFYAPEGCVFVDADYSQIELRLMAHMSMDDSLIAAYNSDKDIHRATAAKVFHKTFDEVTEQDRRNAKAVNFGIIYGISSYGLSQGLSISQKEAKTYIEEYFASYPKVNMFMNQLVNDAKENGYSKTLYNRIRPIPELKDSNFMRRSFGERVAMNAPLQGTAADIMKIAMIRIFNRLKKEAPLAKLILQVHDEVLVQTPEESLEFVKKIVKEEMEAAANLRVSLVADVNSGKNWYEAK